MNKQSLTSQPDDLSPRQEVSSKQTSKSSGRLRAFVSLLLVVLAVGLTYTTYSWMQEKDKNNQLRSQVEPLTKQVGALNSEIDKFKNPAAAETKTQTGTTTAYKAEVGKFTLTLPDEFVIIERLDGGFEGGPATQINIGSRSNKNVSYPVFAEFEIEAVPARTSFDSYIEQKLSDKNDPKENKPLKIGGVNAKVYISAGLFGQKAVLFQNNNIFYTINIAEAGDESKTTVDKILDNVIKGFKFN